MSLRKTLPLLLILFLSTNSHAYQQIEFVREVGQSDKKAKQRTMSAPQALAAGLNEVYVADTDAHRVVVLDLDGKVLRTWGSKGDKAGQFRVPAGIAVDEQARVYVSDTGNHRIQVFDPKGKLLRSFGIKGSGPRQFSGPAGLYAHRGLLYVADRGNSRVQVLSADGIFLQQLSLKTKKDEMKEPVAVAVDAQNKVFVLDRETSMVWGFDQQGSLVSQFGGKGKGSDGLNDPQGLSVDRAGALYISDRGNYKLKKFDGQGRLVGSLGSEGGGPGQFREAAGLTVDAEGRVLVLDSGKNTVQIFSCDEAAGPQQAAAAPLTVEFASETSGQVSALVMDKKLWALSGDSVVLSGATGSRIGTRGSEPGQFKNPRGLAVDSAGKLWIADTGNDRLQRFGTDGTLLQVIGRSGSGEGQFDSPSAIAIGRKGNLYAADAGNRRIQVFNSKGMFLGMFGKSGKLPGQFGEPVDVAVDGLEHLYVADRGNDRIAKYDSNGVLLWETGRTGTQPGEFKQPANVAVSPDDEVYVLDAGNARIQVLSSSGIFLRAFGSEGRDIGEFRSPQGMAFDGSTRLVVGDRGNGRVQTFALRFTPVIPADVTAQARANEIQLNWKAGTESYREEYRIYRSESANGAFALVGTATDPFYLDKFLASNKAFFYRVAGKAREGNEGLQSAPVSAVTPRLMPGVPRRVKIESIEKQITLSWLPNLEPFVSHYQVYRTKQLSAGFERVAKAEATVLVDAPLADETYYYYQVTAVGREGDESPPSEVVFAATPKAALTVPPLEIVKVNVSPVFASAYKYYESHAAGTVIISNNTDTVYPRIKVGFSIKDFMDFPTEAEAENLPAHGQVELQLKPVFSNRILEVTENTPVQSEVALTYFMGGEQRTVTRSFPVTLYERHGMVWDQKAKLGAFVTPKDPPVADLARGVIRPYVDTYPNLHQSLVYARAVYDALGVLGLKYIVDPTSPFQQFSESSTVVDYLQYPRDTLSRKSGDCDDLSVLFAAALENIGIASAFVDVPGHVFVMFDTGVPEKDAAGLGFSDALLVPYQGTVWVPVEMTMVGTSFTRAWQKGAEEYRDWSAKGKAEIVHTQKAWELFKPVTLPTTEARAAKVTREEIEAAFKDELEALGRMRLANVSAGYQEALKKAPNDLESLAQLGILYGENGLYPEALEQFQKMLAVDKNNSLALNNIGNISYLQERLDDARTAYESALKSAPDDAGTLANLARVLLKMGKKEEARKVFEAAAANDPRTLRRYGDLAVSVGAVK